MPLSVWLPEHQDMPVVGALFSTSWAPFAFSWAGALYDLSIPFFLLMRKTRPFAYIAVMLFHGLTWLLFNIGLFPFIMTFSTLIFFSPSFHEKILKKFGYKAGEKRLFSYSRAQNKILKLLMTAFVLTQLLLPFRHWLYPGNVCWNEEGYRFSWRVMLVEKNGLATFHVEDPATGRKSEIINGNYLTRFQEKQMSIQPDFILQFAHFLAEEFREKHGFQNPLITADVFVALNGRSSRRFIDREVNLAVIKDGFKPKNWILPFKP
jgi:hypothetical protein